MNLVHEPFQAMPIDYDNLFRDAELRYKGTGTSQVIFARKCAHRTGVKAALIVYLAIKKAGSSISP